jgi:phosphoserine phosphatase RsbU/P
MPADVPLPADAALYEDAPCGLLVTSRDGTIRRVNRTFCRWLGHEADALVGKRRLQELLTMGGRIFHQTHWLPLLQMQGSVAEVKLDLVHQQGHTLPMMMNALRRGSGESAWHEVSVFVAEDRHRYEKELVRARTQAEELLQQQQESRQALVLAQEEINRQRAVAEDRALFAEQMIGIVSHDLRNPLSTIQMSAYLLERGELSPIERTVLGRINNSTGRAQRLIAELLDFTLARIGTGLTVTAVPAQLHQLVSDSVDELAAAFPERKLVHERMGEGECVVDADRLTQLIGNLVGNAVAYGAADTPVRVTSRIDADGFEISVHNEGTPIPQDVKASLFEPMIRGAAGAGNRGVGLGLFIVREIVRAHHGDVSVTSSAEAGTTFTARFPKVQPAAQL